MFQSSLLATMKTVDRGLESIQKWNVPFQTRMVTVGRLDFNEVVIPHPSISSIHARVYQNGKQIYIEDLQSTNGTYVNGFPVARGELVVLRPEDHLQFGLQAVSLRLITSHEVRQAAEASVKAKPPTVSQKKVRACG